MFTMLADNVQSELELSFALRGLPVALNAVTEVCSALGLSTLLNSNPMDLSGGEKAKLAVALALLVMPKVLVLDNTLEPIDRQARRDVIKVLRHAVNGGLRLIELATTGPAEGEHIDEAVIALNAGTAWIDSTNRRQVERWGETDFTGIPERPELSTEPRLVLDSLSFQYGSGFGISSISLTVHEGEIIWLTGPNGAGKTTLLKCLALLLPGQFGSLQVFNDHKATTVNFPMGKPRLKIHEYLLYQFQEPDDQIFCATVREELLATARQIKGVDGARLEEVASIFGLQSKLEDSPWNLNRSRRRLLTLGSVICADPRIALLDEPTAELDASEKRKVAWALREYVRGGGACIVVSHDDAFMHSIASRTLNLRDGSLSGPHKDRGDSE
jgi:energy-coupling factor transport system ATP-binding protein